MHQLPSERINEILKEKCKERMCTVNSIQAMEEQLFQKSIVDYLNENYEEKSY